MPRPSLGVVGAEVRDIVFEEKVGPVPVRIDRERARIARCTLSVARLPQQGPPAPPHAALAAMLSLASSEVLDAAQCWSCGTPFLVVPLADVGALERCRLDLASWESALAAYATKMVFPVARVQEDTYRARMFAPGQGVAEDPATGSAAAAFAGWLAERTTGSAATSRYHLHQGIEMGRPSLLELEFDRGPAGVSAVRVGGGAVLVCEGTLHL